MSAQANARQWFDNLVERNQARLTDSDQDWLNATREQARQSVNQLPIPDYKAETWRYTTLDSLYTQEFDSQAAPVTGLDEDDIEQWIYPSSDSYRLVFANGRCVPALSNVQQLPDSIKIGSLRTALSADRQLITQSLSQNIGRDADVFTALNRALIDDGLFIHVGQNVELPLPIEVVFLNTSFEGNTLSQPHSLLILDADARVKLIEHFVSTGDSRYFFNGISQVCLGEHASLEHYRLQDESRGAYHLSRLMIEQETASEYRGFSVATGAAWHRTDIGVRFNGPQASCDLSGVFTVTGRQYTDFHLDVQHVQPGCRSHEDFRGIVAGQGRAVFDGRVIVHKAAQKTDAMLHNKNLLLSKNGEVDTKPQLEIYADDVKCGHGAAVGKIDPDQLFYMRARGIDEAVAKQMLCLGFAEQLLANVTDEKVHERLRQQVAEALSNTGA